MADPQTFEEVDQYVNSLQQQPVAMTWTPGQPAAAIDVCSAWRTARPVITWVFALPFFPAKWKAAVQPLLNLLDTFCPAQP